MDAGAGAAGDAAAGDPYGGGGGDFGGEIAPLAPQQRRPIIRVEDMTDSQVPLVGAQRTYTTRLCTKGVQIEEAFLVDMITALRVAAGILLAALPTYMKWEWMDGWTLDLSYAAVMCVFVTGRTCGETIKLIWQATMGSITAAIAPQLAINTFGEGWFAVAVFVFFYTLIVLSLPMEAITKKFALGITLNYLMHSAKHSAAPQPEPALPSNVTYEVLVLGLWGCLPALLVANILPFKTAKREAKLKADKLVEDIERVVMLLLRGYCEGQTALDRTRLVKYFASMEHNIADMSRNLSDAWYEPGSTPVVTKLSSVLTMVFKLRAELYGMQKALTDEQSRQFNEENYKDVMFHLEVPMQELVERSLDLLHSVQDLIVQASAEKYQESIIQESTASGPSMRDTKNMAVRQQIKSLIENGLGDGGHLLDDTKESLAHFHAQLSKLRESSKDRERNRQITRSERIEMDGVLMMFVFSVTGFAQQLVDFSDEFAETMQEAQVHQSWFAADTKMVALQFQRKQLVAALKTALALTASATCNAYFFDYEATGPVMIAYLMAGHVGSSYANTVSRVLGVLIGALGSFCILIFAQCNDTVRAIGFFVIIFLASFVRFTSPHASYMGLSAAVACCPVLVRQWDSCATETEIKEQYDIVRQVVFSCSLLVIAEICVWQSTGLENLQKKISDTLTECKSAFKDMSEYNAALYAAGGDKFAVAAGMDAAAAGGGGSKQKNKDPKKTLSTIEVSLWASIPGSLREEGVFLEDAKAEPTMWRTEFPASAYTRVVDSSIKISVHLMLLRNAWKRLNELALEQKQQNKSLLMDVPHVQARALVEEEPKSRPVQASVQVKIGNIARIRDLMRDVAQAVLPRDAGPASIDVKTSQRAINGRRNKTEVIVILPSLTPAQAQQLADGMKNHDILLMFDKNKEFNNGGRTEIHVPAVRMLTESHQALLGKLDADGNPPPGACSDGFKLRDESKPVVGVVHWDKGVGVAVRRVKWLHSLGRNALDEAWRPMGKGEVMEYMIKEELQFDFKHGNIMEHVGILSHKITEGFQEVAATLRLNAVFDKDLNADDDDSFFQTPDEYDGSRCVSFRSRSRSRSALAVSLSYPALPTTVRLIYLPTHGLINLINRI